MATPWPKSRIFTQSSANLRARRDSLLALIMASGGEADWMDDEMNSIIDELASRNRAMIRETDPNAQ